MVARELDVAAFFSTGNQRLLFHLCSLCGLLRGKAAPSPLRMSCSSAGVVWSFLVS